jgi:hypothetical protein
VAKSTTPFDRWTPLEPTSWSFQIFRMYDEELMKLWGSHLSSRAFTYSQLGSIGAQWTDKPGKHFKVGVQPVSYCSDMKSWSDAFNTFDNWVNLSVVLTVASNLETYFGSVVRLALDSDPGVVLGTSKAVDGAFVQKYKKVGALDISAHIEACTKGDWSSRLSALERVFGGCPADLRAIHGDLEMIRTVRNRFSHAFGRNINEARRTGTLSMLPMEKMTRKTAERLRNSALRGARSLDHELLSKHVGDFEAVLFYQRLHPTLRPQASQGERAISLKKAIGHHGASLRGKVYCMELVEYWDAL